MIETISFTELVQWVIMAFVIGFFVGGFAALWFKRTNDRLRRKQYDRGS